MSRRFCLSCQCELDPMSVAGCECGGVPAQELDWNAPRGTIDVADRDHEAGRARRAEREQQLDDATRRD